MFREFSNFDSQTLVLYFSIVVLSTILGVLSQKKRSDGIKFRVIPFFISFILLAFFSCTNDVGIDKENYSYFYEISTIGDVYEYFEPGFRVYIAFLKFFGASSRFFLSSISFLTVLFVYKGLWDWHKEIDIGFAIFVFVSQYYFQSFNLMRMYFAISILIAGSVLFKKQKYWTYLLVCLVAMMFHYSIVFPILGYLIFLYLKNTMPYPLKIRIVLLSFLAFLFGIVSYRLIILVAMFIPKYAMYAEASVTTQVGFKWIMHVIPYLFILGLSRYFENKRAVICLSAGYMIMTVFISLVSYFVQMIGRAIVCFNFPIIFLLPNALCLSRKDISKKTIFFNVGHLKIKMGRTFFIAIMTIFFLFNFILYLSEYMTLDAIDNFKFFWNTKL